MTVSTDGLVLWWDIRKLSEAVESMPLRWAAEAACSFNVASSCRDESMLQKELHITATAAAAAGLLWQQRCWVSMHS
jgi:hypothetical protein